MEILHFCPSRSFSGLEQYALELAADQRVKGRSVGFVVSPGSRLEQECARAGIETITFNPFLPLWVVTFWPKFARLLFGGVRVIHVHSTQELVHLSFPVFLRKMASSRKPKVILQSHIWINHRKMDFFHKALYSLVDEVWCSSEEAKKSLLQHLPVAESRIKVISYGRNVDEIEKGFLSRDEARRALKLPENGIMLATVSRLEESKGIREFLEASLPLLLKDANLNVVVIGGPSPKNESAALYASRLSRFIAEQPSGIQQRIHLLGTVPESHKFLKAFDLYVVPSYQETFSLALLDAQLAGLPVVGSDSGGTPEVVVQGGTGWLFEPRNVSSLRRKLQEALSEKAAWKTYGGRAAERVRRDFNQRKVFENILSEYER